MTRAEYFAKKEIDALIVKYDRALKINEKRMNDPRTSQWAIEGYDAENNCIEYFKLELIKIREIICGK